MSTDTYSSLLTVLLSADNLLRKSASFSRWARTVSSESVAMFGSFGLFVVWCFTVWKSHLALQRESKVLLRGFLTDFSAYYLNQWLWRYALFKMEITLQCFPSF